MGRDTDKFGSGGGTSAKADDYGEEFLYANGNPAVSAMGVAGPQCEQEPGFLSFEIISEDDVDDFLARVYMLACQI